MTQKQIEARKRFKQMFSVSSKLNEVKKEYRKRRDREYRAENKEQYALHQRNYYRTRNGIPLDAPVMTTAESAENARKARLQKLKDKQ